jgi:hypothetical protein
MILRISRHILDNTEERWEIHAFLLSHALCLKQHEVVDGLMEPIDLEVLPTPNEAATRLADGGTIGIGLLQ